MPSSPLRPVPEEDPPIDHPFNSRFLTYHFAAITLSAAFFLITIWVSVQHFQALEPHWYSRPVSYLLPLAALIVIARANRWAIRRATATADRTTTPSPTNKTRGHAPSGTHPRVQSDHLTQDQPSHTLRGLDPEQ